MSSVILLRLPSSSVWDQLTLTVPCWGTGAPYPQSGVPFPRIRTHFCGRNARNTAYELTLVLSLFTTLCTGCCAWLK
jgi:hypothetical protein